MHTTVEVEVEVLHHQDLVLQVDLEVEEMVVEMLMTMIQVCMV
tara:strand:+ start:344 stop:472 length:129 start_codon:yes stop_codon:yes gene_type:complete